jgi:hypothetical protein
MLTLLAYENIVVALANLLKAREKGSFMNQIV